MFFKFSHLVLVEGFLFETNMFVSKWVFTFFTTNFQSRISTGSHQVTFHPNGHDLVGHLGGDHGLLCRFSFRSLVRRGKAGHLMCGGKGRFLV